MVAVKEQGVGCTREGHLFQAPTRVIVQACETDFSLGTYVHR